MKIKIEQPLHACAAAVTVATVFGLNPDVAALLLALISVGLSISAGLRR